MSTKNDKAKTPATKIQITPEMEVFQTALAKRRSKFDRPRLSEQFPEIKVARAGSKRAIIVELMKRPEGASMIEIHQATGWDLRTAYDGITLVHKQLGYGISEDDEGRLRVVA